MSINVKENKWLGRSLNNYKDMHSGSARQKGVYNEFINAKTLTQAKKILNGYKRGQTK